MQERLATNREGGRAQGRASEALLLGRIVDERGNRMTPTHANKGGVRYRYYTSCVLAQGRRDEAGGVSRVPAPEVEALVVDAVREATGGEGLAAAALIEEHVERIVVREGSIEISLQGGTRPPLLLAWTKPSQVRRREVIGAEREGGRPMRAEARERLLTSIARARLWLAELLDGSVAGTAALAEREGLSERAVRLTLSLAFLAPDLVRAAVAGTLPRGAGLSSMTELPPIWTEQRLALTN